MADPRISDLLQAARRPLLSYEFFPPRDDLGYDRLRTAAERLRETRPDFVTCTWGAGGSTRSRTLEICDFLRQVGFSPVMPHLTCVGVSREELREIADEMHQRGYRNIMTLRGDPPHGQADFRPHPDGLRHASELVALLKERHSDFCCGVAGYPEKHVEAVSPEEDLLNLKRKIDAGADFITTQLFFDNRYYRDFAARCIAAGIRTPILAGLLPAMSLKQVQRFTTLCGSSFPEPLARAMQEAGGEGAAAEDVGIRWAAGQIERLLADAAPGIHLYVLNRSKAAMATAVKACFDRVRSAP
jgi:methylenetetrahydrofolate reductase (NADPH)